MAESKRLGTLGEIAVMREALQRGDRVSVPISQDAPYDLVVERQGGLERVQVTYVRSDGRVIHVRCRSTNGWATHKYRSHEVDWIATYDESTERVYFVHSSECATGRAVLHLRLEPAANNQVVGVRFAADHLEW